MNMMATINRPAVADDEAGVEIIPTTATANEESPNSLVDATAPPMAKSWMTKEVFISIGALLCFAGAGGAYFLTPASGKTTNFSSSNQMEQAAEEVGYEYERLNPDMGKGYCADSKDKVYPYVGYWYSVNSPEECGEKCSECPGNCEDGLGLVLRGFDFVSGQYCNCLVDFGIEFDDSVCEGVDGASDKRSGSGEIAMFYGGDPPARGNECWKVSSKGSKVKSRNCGGTKASRKPKSSKQPIRKLGQKNDSLNNMGGKTDSQTVSE